MKLKRGHQKNVPIKEETKEKMREARLSYHQKQVIKKIKEKKEKEKNEYIY